MLKHPLMAAGSAVAEGDALRAAAALELRRLDPASLFEREFAGLHGADRRISGVGVGGDAVGEACANASRRDRRDARRSAT